MIEARSPFEAMRSVTATDRTMLPGPPSQLPLPPHAFGFDADPSERPVSSLSSPTVHFHRFTAPRRCRTRQHPFGITGLVGRVLPDPLPVSPGALALLGWAALRGRAKVENTGATRRGGRGGNIENG